MNIHHARRHQAYVNNANAAAERWPELAKMKIEDVLRDLSKAPEAVRTAIRNNVGGHWNHTYFLDMMTPGGARKPQGRPQVRDRPGVPRTGQDEGTHEPGGRRQLDVISTANQDTSPELGVRSMEASPHFAKRI